MPPPECSPRMDGLKLAHFPSGYCLFWVAVVPTSYSDYDCTDEANRRY